jgi:hypothetical protein
MCIISRAFCVYHFIKPLRKSPLHGSFPSLSGINLRKHSSLSIKDLQFIFSYGLYQKIGSPENFSLYKIGHMGANSSKCIAKASLGEIGPYKVSQKHIFSPKVKYVIMRHYQKIGSPENFSLYKAKHMGPNGSKCTAKAIIIDLF